jgi:hypothetical protein
MSAQVPPALIDRLIELYCDWRSQCWNVRAAYAQFTAATARDRTVAYAAYRAALDREESAAGVYAQQLARVRASAQSGAVTRQGELFSNTSP